MNQKFQSLKDYIIRDKGVVNGNKLEFLYSFKNFPLFFGCVDSPIEDDLIADMEWVIDKSTGAIQLSKLIPLEILYQEQHMDGTGPTWQKYYLDFAEYINSYNNSHNILEIGGGSGQLAKIVTSKNNLIKWTVIEPNPRIESSNQINVIDGFFDHKLCLEKGIDTIVISQVLEHIYEPSEFIKEISIFLNIGGKVILAYPQTKVWLDKKYTNAINFEHTFLIDDFIEYLFCKNGFKTLDKEIYKEHSIFYTFENKRIEYQNLEIPNKYDEYKKIFSSFISYHQSLIKDLNTKISESNLPVYLFGAHIFATYLFSFGLSKNIKGILDNSKIKQNRRLYGTPFIVSSPKILKGQGEVNVILKAGHFNDEIKKDIFENINANVNFW